MYIIPFYTKLRRTQLQLASPTKGQEPPRGVIPQAPLNQQWGGVGHRTGVTARLKVASGMEKITMDHTLFCSRACISNCPTSPGPRPKVSDLTRAMSSLLVLHERDALGADPTISKKVSLSLGTNLVGRETIGVVDKRLSRKQLEVRIGANGYFVKRTGPNASFLQNGKAITDLELNVECRILPKSVIWLSRDPSTLSYTHPVSVHLAVAPLLPPSAAAPALAPHVPPAPALAPPLSSSPGSTLPSSRGVWEVLLGGVYKAYESAAVQHSLEEAFIARLPPHHPHHYHAETRHTETLAFAHMLRLHTRTCSHHTSLPRPGGFLTHTQLLVLDSVTTQKQR